MEKLRFVVISEYGIHSRPAKKLVEVAMGFESNIYLTAYGRTVNLKSIMGVLSLGVHNGEIIEITAEGADEKKAAEGLLDVLVSEGLGRVEYE